MDAEMRPAPASPARVEATDDTFLKDVTDAANAEAKAADRERGEGQRPKDDGDFDEAAFMQLALERATLAQSAWEEPHRLFRKDTDFLGGNQWPEQILDDRIGRVNLTLNQLPKFVRQVLNDGKQNRIQIKVSPVEGDTANLTLKNRAGTKDYTLAQTMEGIVRNIESLSKAETAYDNALEHCVQGGFGWLKIDKRYARPDGFEQEIVIRAKRNPYSVLFDPEAMLSDEPNFLGGNYCFEHVELNRKDAEKKYGNVSDFDSLPENARPWWGTSDMVRIARYWYIETKPTTYVLLSNGATMTEADVTAAAQQLAAAGITVVNSREGEERCLHWADIDGGRVLNGPHRGDGGYLPLIPVLGPSLWLDGKVVYESLIRHSHDAQRMYNYWRSAATEAVALAPKSPWLADAASIAGFERDYEAASEVPVNLLKYRWREGVPPPQRMNSANNPAAEISQALQANDDIKGTLGLYDASIGARSNETSGVAIQRRQQEGDVGTYNWHDSLAKAIAAVGTVLVDMIPRIYDTERMVRLRTPDDGEDFVQINYTITDESGQPMHGLDGKVVRADLGIQRYDVVANTGPSVMTQRQAAAESQMEFMGIAAKVSPQHAASILDKVAAGMDWQNADDIAARLRKMLPPNLLEPAELEEVQRQQQQMQPDPQAQQKAAEEQQLAQAEAQAKLIDAQAKMITAQAKLAEAQSMAPEKIKDLIAEAIAELVHPAAA